ncbi:hypothetical protein D3C76_1202130 [compost metagenome]
MAQPVGEDDQVRGGLEMADKAVDADQAVGEYEGDRPQRGNATTGQRAPEHRTDGQGVHRYRNQQLTQAMTDQYSQQRDTDKRRNDQSRGCPLACFAQVAAQVRQMGAKKRCQAKYEQVARYGQKDVAQ